MADLTQFNTALARLAAGELSGDELAELKANIDRAMEAAKELLGEYRKAMTEMLEGMTPGASVTVGTIRYYLGNKKETSAVSAGEALNAAIELAGGDLDAACRDFLCSDPFKHGSMRKALEGAGKYQRFLALFKVEEKVELKEGVAKKGLQAVDTRFVK